MTKPCHKKSQARDYIKEWRSLRSLRNSNTQSLTSLKPLSDVLAEDNLSSERSHNLTTNSNLKHDSFKFHSSASSKKFGSHKVGKAFRKEYIKKKQRMNTLNSTSNLRKHLSTSKSFTSLHPKNSIENDRLRNLEKLSKGVRKWEIELVPKILYRNSEKPLAHYKSQSTIIPSINCTNCESVKLLETEICALKNQISVLEYKREFELKQYEVKESKFIQDYEAKLQEKDIEIERSKVQITQLMNIMKQLAKQRSAFNEQDSLCDTMEDLQNMVVQELLESSEAESESIHQSLNKRSANRRI